MKIKDFFDKNGYIAPTLCTIALAMNIYNIHKTDEMIEEREQMIKMLTEHEFDPFEQTVFVPLYLDEDQVIQIDGHLAYKPVNVVDSSYFEDGPCILFSNTEEVVTNGGEDFGEVVQDKDFSTKEGEFLPYQHILIVSEDNHDTWVNPQEYDGYESIGFGDVQDDIFYYTLYTNTETVKCTNYTVEDGNTKSLEFGTPVEKAKVLRKEQ